MSRQHGKLWHEISMSGCGLVCFLPHSNPVIGSMAYCFKSGTRIAGCGNIWLKKLNLIRFAGLQDVHLCQLARICKAETCPARVTL